MNKVLVEIFVPAVKESFDVYLPDKIPIHQLTGGIAKVITDLTEGKFTAARDVALCDDKTGAVYDINLNARELLLHNSSRLMLL